MKDIYKLINNKDIKYLSDKIYLLPFSLYNSSTEFNNKTLVDEGYHLFYDNKQLSLRNFGINIFTKYFNEYGFCILKVQPEDKSTTLKNDCIINKKGEIVYESKNCLRSLSLMNNIVIDDNKIYNLLTKEYILSIQSQYLSSTNYLVGKRSLFGESMEVKKKEYQKYRDCLILLDTITCEIKILE